MRTNHSKALTVAASLLGLVCLTATLPAAISVGATGAGPFAFDAAPSVGQWSTRIWPGGSGSGSPPNGPTSRATLDAAVQTNSASAINAALAGAGNPPASAGSALWSSNGHYVATRPTTVAYAGMMATLQNDSGENVTNLNLSYDLTAVSPVSEEAPGHLVYYSLSGAPNGWVQIPELSGDGATGAKSATLDLSATPWLPGATLYVLWADDNAAATPDTALEIDNVRFALPSPPVITDASSLTNQSVPQCHAAAAMSVTAVGGPTPAYQWFHNGSAIPGATGPSFGIASMTAADAGDYYVHVENPLGQTNSPTAHLTFLPDTVPPALLTAFGSPSLTEITLTFDEALNTNGPTGNFLSDLPFNFELIDTNTGVRLNIIYALAPNDTTLVLQTDPYDPAHGHSLLLVNVTDKCADNLLPDTTVAVHTVRTALVPSNAVWRYDDTDADPGATWFQPGHDDSGWPSGPGPFDAKRNAGGTAGAHCRDATLYGLGSVGTCLSLTSPITQTNLITANFRSRFTFGGHPANTILELRGKVDDGAVIYLNGSELQRIRVAAAPAAILRTTFANAIVNDPDAQDFFVYTASPLLRSGDNFLAVELHQVNLTSTDLTLGLELTALTTGPPVPAPANLALTLSGGNATITWNGGGTLEYTDHLTAPPDTIVWQAVAEASSPYVTPAGAARRFYRVRVP